MKTILKLIVLSSLLLVVTNSYSQAPEGINYQATVRNASGNLITNQSVSVIFAIKQNSTSGTIVYQENQTLTTNAYGGFVAIIGKGTVTSGTFAGINWGGDDHFLNVQVNGNDLGTTQMMSVPYALQAKKATIAENLSNPVWKKKASNGDYFTVGEPVIIGDSVQSANRLTIKDNSGGSETVDIIQTNAGVGDDVINMNVTTSASNSAPGQFLECAANGNVKAKINTNGIIELDSNLKISDGEINVTQKTGSANLIPIAYGFVSPSGSITTSGKTNNFSVVKSSTGIYDITITGESYYFSSYVCNVTLSDNAGFVTSTSISGKLRIYTRNTGGILTDRSFYFIVYKP